MADGAVLDGAVPIGGNNALVENPFGDERGFALARCNLAGAAGDAQAFQRHEQFGPRSGGQKVVEDCGRWNFCQGQDTLIHGKTGELFKDGFWCRENRN